MNNDQSKGAGLRQPISLALAADLAGGRLIGADGEFLGVSTDTRSLNAGELYIALRGPNFDGHDFADEAQHKKASALLVQRRLDSDLPQILVDDTRLAFGRLAAGWRARFDIPVIAVTGSNGKTTVKEMIASILARCGSVLVTDGNLNNDIGVPKTLMRLNRNHAYAVIELGANRPGDIRYLTGLVRPLVAVITNAGQAHLQGFGDIAGVARSKGEIFEGLQDQGVAVLNNDDARIGIWQAMTEGRRAVSFGVRYPADVSARDLHINEELGCSFFLDTQVGSTRVDLRLAGRHNVMNAVTAAAVATVLGVELNDIREGLAAMRPVSGRLQMKRGIGGVRVIDDTYNANPGSVKAALEVLASAGKSGQKVLVLGDMGELGNASQALHEQVGRQARVIGVDALYALGPQSVVTAGCFAGDGRHFTSASDLIEVLLQRLAEARGRGQEITVLVKGSRRMHMEEVVNALTSGIDNGAVLQSVRPLNGAPGGKFHRCVPWGDG